MKHCMKCGNQLHGMERYIDWETLEIVIKKRCKECNEDVTFTMEAKIKDIAYEERD